MIVFGVVVEDRQSPPKEEDGDGGWGRLLTYVESFSSTNEPNVSFLKGAALAQLAAIKHISSTLIVPGPHLPVRGRRAKSTDLIASISSLDVLIQVEKNRDSSAPNPESLFYYIKYSTYMDYITGQVGNVCIGTVKSCYWCSSSDI